MKGSQTDSDNSGTPYHGYDITRHPADKLSDVSPGAQAFVAISLVTQETPLFDPISVQAI